jgi:cell division initiation protein
MRVTPLEIRQKTFGTAFRGYEKDEINAFLLTLSQEWERIIDENKELRIKFESAEREVSKLREVENSLYKTLKTAEDTGANVIEQARQSADLHLKESQLKSEAMLNEAKTKAKDTIEESDMRAKQILAEMEDRLKLMVETYKKLETSREDLLSEIKRIASDALDRAERARIQTKNFDVDQHLNMAKREARKVAFPNSDMETPVKKEVPRVEPVVAKEPVVVKEPIIKEKDLFADQKFVPETAASAKTLKSFFDEIG